MVQDIIFWIMMIVAVGAGTITAAHEIGGRRKQNPPEENKTAEKTEKKGNN